MSQHKKRRRAFARLFDSRQTTLMSELKEIARKNARGDAALQEDLLQAGLSELWMKGAILMMYSDPIVTAIRFARRAMKRYLHRHELRPNRIRRRIVALRDPRLVELHRESRRAERVERRPEDAPQEVVEHKLLARELRQQLDGKRVRRRAA